jgi:hypothetical protein
VCGRYYSLFDKQQVAEHFHVRCIADNVGIIAQIRPVRNVLGKVIHIYGFCIQGMAQPANKSLAGIDGCNAESVPGPAGIIWR